MGLEFRFLKAGGNRCSNGFRAYRVALFYKRTVRFALLKSTGNLCQRRLCLLVPFGFLDFLLSFYGLREHSFQFQPAPIGNRCRFCDGQLALRFGSQSVFGRG